MSNLKICKTFPAGASALTKGKMVDTAGGVVVTTTATDTAIGVVEDGCDANATECNICMFGITRVEAHDAAISNGDLLELAAAGRVDTHDGSTGNPVVGRALEDSNSQGHLIEVFLFPQSDAGPAA